MKEILKIGTRSSQLALWQAEWVQAQINQIYPELKIELVKIKTKGDKILDVPLSKVGGKGLFVKELEIAMLEGEIDIAVHSMKDVPSYFPEGLELSVITKRGEHRDAFVSNNYNSFDELPKGAIVGTSSLRRVAQLKKRRPDLEFKDLRGNVNTRLGKLDNNEYDAIILAAAGLIRLEMENRIQEYLSVDISLPAICQGVVGIESRIGDLEVLDIIKSLEDELTLITTKVERAFLTRLNGGCQVPIAGYATLSDGEITMTGLVSSLDGLEELKVTGTAPFAEAEELGRKLAEDVLEEGGREILRECGIESK